MFKFGLISSLSCRFFSFSKQYTEFHVTQFECRVIKQDCNIVIFNFIQLVITRWARQTEGETSTSVI